MIKKLPSVASGAFALNSLFFVSVCIMALLISSESRAQSVFLKDLNERESTDEFEFSSLIGGNGKTFVIVRGRELWASYLAANDQDVVVKLGTYDSVTNLTMVGDKLYYTALTTDKGMELYRSDGSPEGTHLVNDIYPGTGNSNPAFLVDVNGTLYFSATNGTSGKELWKSNGTAASTVLVKNIFPKGGSSNPSHLTNVNGVLFFAASDGTNGYELWKSNGSTEGTVLVKDIRPEPKISSSPDQFKNVAGTLYFAANEPASGRELYKSDGTATGTVLVKDIRAGTGSSSISNLTANGNTLIFTASDGLTGAELWKSDGTAAGTVLVKDMTPGLAGSNGEQSGQHKMANFTSINGQVYYTAYERNTYMIWKTDGTTAGTVAIVPANGAVNEQPRPRFVSMNGYIFFFNSTYPESWSILLTRMNPDGSDYRSMFETYINDQNSIYSPELVVIEDKNGVNHLYWYGILVFEGYELLKSAGEDYEDTYSLPDPYIPTASSNPHDFKRHNNKTFFIANPTWYDNQALWAADGNDVQEVFSFSYNGGEFAFTDNKVYASGQDWLELHRANGDGYSSEYLGDDNYNLPPAIQLTGVKSRMFFTNADAGLYVIDDANTQVTFLKDFTNLYDFEPVGTSLVFRSRNSSNGEELWRSNGTSSGTIRFATISPTFQTPSLYRPTATINTNTHYFIANDGVHGNEIWRTQGSGAATYMLVDLNPNDHLFIQGGKENDIRSMVEFRDSLYVSAVDNAGSWALYKTKGTVAAGMHKVLNINQVVEMVEAQGRLYLFVLDTNDASKLNIYITNGTAQSTRFLFQIPTLQYSHAEVLNSLYVRAASGNNEVWRTDGTACGTFSFDLGVQAGNEIGEFGAALIFPGLHPDKGVEPYYYDTTPFLESCNEETLAANESPAQLMQGNEGITSAYPNPFRNELVLRIAGDNRTEARVQVYTVSGTRVDDLGTLKCNTDHSIGSAWPLGMYVLKINAGGKLSSQKVVKTK